MSHILIHKNRMAGRRETFHSAEQALQLVFEGISTIDGNQSEEENFDLDSDHEETSDVVRNDVEDGESAPSEEFTQNEEAESDEMNPEANLPGTSTNYKFLWMQKEFEQPPCEFQGKFSDPPTEPYTPGQYVKKFLTQLMLESVAHQTNLYSVQEDGVSVCTTAQEVEQFIGLYYQMGLVQMPNIRAYWEAETRFPPVADIMSRNRFEKLKRMLHFEDNLSVTEEMKKDKLWKIRPWLHSLRAQYLLVENEEHQAIDEMMFPFKGRSHLRQYMPMKPHKGGLKYGAGLDPLDFCMTLMSTKGHVKVKQHKSHHMV